MAGALGVMDYCFGASIDRTQISTSSSSPSANGSPQKFLTLRSSFTLRSRDSRFWNGGVGACALVLAAEDSIRQRRGGARAVCAQMNIFEDVVRIVRSGTTMCSINLGILTSVASRNHVIAVGTRPAFARTTLPPPTSTTSFVDEIENEGTLNRNVEPGVREVRPSQSGSAKKEKEEDPAELVLQAFLDRHPDDLKALEGLMYVRLQKGDIEKALEVIDKLLALKPDHAPWQLIRAQSLDFVGDSDQARQAFEAILARDPLSARALQGLATVMLKVGEGQEMLEMLKRAVETAVETRQIKESKNLRMLLGQMHTIQGNYEEALDQYTELLKEDPRDFRPYLCQGLVYTLMNKKVQADSAFRKYRQLCPKTFPERGYLDDLLIGAKVESKRLQDLERFKPTAKGTKEPKPLRQPNLDTAVARGVEDFQD